MLMFIYNCINCIVKTKEHRTKNSCKRQKNKEKDKENLKKKTNENMNLFLSKRCLDAVSKVVNESIFFYSKKSNSHF